MKLRALEPEDLDLLYTLENEPEMWETSESDAPYSRYILKQYIAEGNSFFTSGEVRLAIEIENKETQVPKTIGIIDLTNYAPQSSRAQIGIALLKEFRNQGYGTKAIQLMERMAAGRLRLHTLYAYVSEHNQASCQLFIKNGYLPAARLPEWFFHNGKYESTYLFLKKIEK